MLAVAAIVAVIFLSTSVILSDAKFLVPKEKNIVAVGNSLIECSIDDNIATHYVNLGKSATHNMFAYIKIKKILADNDHIDTIVMALSPAQINKEIDNRWLLDTYISPQLNYMVYFSSFYDYDFSVMSKSSFLISTLRSTPITIVYYASDQLFGRSIDIKDRGIGRYLRQTHTMTPQSKVENSDISTVDTNSVQYRYLLKIMQLCKEKSVNLQFINTPMRGALLYDKQEFMSLCRERLPNINYTDFADFPLADSCFADNVHLNYRGAEVFSNYINRYGLQKDSIKVFMRDYELK